MVIPRLPHDRGHCPGLPSCLPLQYQVTGNQLVVELVQMLATSNGKLVGIVVIVENVTKKVDNVTHSDHLPSIDVMRERRADLPVSRPHSESFRGLEIVPVAVRPSGNYQDLQQKV